MRVTVIPTDNTILVDGEVLVFNFTADPSVHALQWYGTHGTFEYVHGPAEWFADPARVQPFIDAFQAEKARLAAVANGGV